MKPSTSHRAPRDASARTFRHQRLVVSMLVLTALGVVAALGIERVTGATKEEPHERTVGTTKLPPKPSEHALRIGSLNVLAAEHTEAAKARPTPAPARLVTQLLDRHGLDVAGLQGLTGAQLATLEAARDGIRTFPHRQPAKADERAAIAWRSARWKLVRARVDKTKAADGRVATTPYVLLKNLASKRKVYVINVPLARRTLNQPALNGLRLKAELGARGVPVVMTSQAGSAQPARASAGRKQIRITPVPDPFEGLSPTAGAAPVEVARATLPRKDASFDFRVASYNVLGSSHTGGGGDRPGRPSGTYRIGVALGIVRAQNVDVVGFQEFQDDQINRFNSLTGDSWDVYPGAGPQGSDSHNTIAWRTDVWDLVESHSIAIPYFHGHLVQMPYVLLKHRDSGREVWFANFHNPADVAWAHNQGRFRYAATSKEIALANELTATGRPLILTGDMNQREEYFCRMTAGAPMGSASGGSTGSPCSPPAKPRIDWIFGSTRDVDFDAYTVVDGSEAHRASDHLMVAATAHVEDAELRADFSLGDLVLPESPGALEPWAPAAQRMRTTYDLMEEAGIDIIGFQEMRATQLATLKQLAGDDWAIYPGSEDSRAMQSSIAWRTSEWSRVKAGTLAVQGAQEIPYVLLQNNSTGQQLYVANTYNPVPSADAGSDDWRSRADAAVGELVRTLSKSGIPVVVTGGLTEGSQAVCRLDKTVPLTLASDTTAEGTRCVANGDQIVATRGVEFSNYSVMLGGLVRLSTDTPLVTADAEVGN